MNAKDWNKWLVKHGIDWEDKVMRSDIIKVIESMLREKFGWNEVRMCEELFKFIGIDVGEFRKYGIEPCSWLNGLELLSDLRRPYWLGMRVSDLVVRRLSGCVELALSTTNSVDAIFFLALLKAAKTPRLAINWKRKAPAARYVHNKPISLTYYVSLSTDKWSWPIELSGSELERVLSSFSDEELAEFIAGVIDGDGEVLYYYNDVFESESVLVAITVCKNCPKRTNLNILKEVIAERFGIIGNIYSRTDTDINVLTFYNRNAVNLLRCIIKYIHHPLKRLRAELILMYYNGRISRKEFESLYDMTKYVFGGPDVKRNHALEALIRAAPQTHTHGGQR
jgi:hypothetical protein